MSAVEDPGEPADTYSGDDYSLYGPAGGAEADRYAPPAEGQALQESCGLAIGMD